MKTPRVKEFDASPQPIEFKHSPREIISSVAEKFGKFVNKSLGMEYRNPNRNKRTGIGVAIGAVVATASLALLSINSDTECATFYQEDFGGSLTDATNEASEVIMKLDGNPDPSEIAGNLASGEGLKVCGDPDVIEQLEADFGSN